MSRWRRSTRSGNPTILATFTVIAAILPMAMVRGLMGPYMRPIPIGASAAMIFLAAGGFCHHALGGRAFPARCRMPATRGGEVEDWTTRLYRRFMGRLLSSDRNQWLFLGLGLRAAAGVR